MEWPERRPVHILDEEEVDDDFPELQPEPQPEPPRPVRDETWDAFMARQRAHEAMREAREVGQRDRAVQWFNQEGQRRVAVYNRLTGNYEIRNG